MNIRIIALLALPFLAACDDPFGPRDWIATPDTALLWSASRPALIGFESAVDFTTTPPRGVAIEATGASQNWDVVLLDVNGQLALAPSSYFLGQGERSAVSEQPNTTLAAVTRAPGDTASYKRTPIPVKLGNVYIVRTRVAVCEGGFSSGVRYVKLQPVAIDPQAGSFRFAFVRNPYCDDRDLIPPDEK